jgi:hypothetical protein
LLDPVKLANSRIGFVLANQDGVLQVIGLPLTSFGEFLRVKSASNSAHLFFQILLKSKNLSDLKNYLSNVQYNQLLNNNSDDSISQIFSLWSDEDNNNIS